MENLGKNIRLLQVQRKMSQDQLAEALHVTRQTVSNYETGHSRPDVEMLTALAEALRVDVKELLYGPARQEHCARRLVGLVAGAVLTGLVGILYFVGGPWAQRLLEERFPGVILRGIFPFCIGNLPLQLPVAALSRPLDGHLRRRMVP